MSRKPQTTAEYHDASAANCVLRQRPRVVTGNPVRDGRTCLRCLRDARNATRRRAHRP